MEEKKKYFEHRKDNSCYFRFLKIDYEEDFSLLKNIIISDMCIKLEDTIKAPYSDIAIFKQDDLEFDLEFDFNYGISIYILDEYHTEENINKLREIVEKIYDIYAEKYPENLK